MTKFLREHFRVISIVTREDGTSLAEKSVAVATERLLEMAHRYKDDPWQYFDIVGRK